jgi:GntR family transcriptional regulator
MVVLLSNTDNEPLFAQIKRQIRRQIVTGALTEGEELPSMRRLALDLQVSLITTKRAYDDLEAEGLIRSIPGRGCFVAPQSVEYLLDKKRNLVQEKLAESIGLARDLGLARNDVQTLFNLLWENE